MADYEPLHHPGHAWTSTASAAVVGGKALTVSGSGTVANATTAANIIIGIASQDAAASGDKVGVFGRGPVHQLTASGTVTAGDVVEAAAAGAVATHTQGTNDVRVFGIALTTATTGNLVEIMEL